MSTGARDLLIFVGIFVLMFIVWATTGGPQRYVSQAGPYIDAPAPLGSGQPYGTSTGIYGLSGLGFNYNPPTFDPNSVPKETIYNTPNKQFQSGSTIPPQSTTGINQGSSVVRGADTEFVEFRVPSGNPVVLQNGLFLSDDIGTKVEIPSEGSRLLSSGVPAREPISIGPDDVAYIISGRSPVGISFRSNKCSGYLAQFQKFVPQIPPLCPTPSREISAGCASAISAAPLCTSVTNAQTLLEKKVSPACINEIQTKLTYIGCVNAHKNDPDFDGRQWRIYLSKTSPLWSRSGNLRIIDQSGASIVPLQLRASFTQ